MKISFTKLQGLGNDFVLLDCLKTRIKALSCVVRGLSDRRYGIGFDQALILLPSEKADFRMDIYNGDGGRVEMCGNGIRCFASYIWNSTLSKRDILRVETLAGIVVAERSGEMVRVDMGAPVLEGRKIPVGTDGEIIDHCITAGGEEFKVTVVSMGNPHSVIFVPELNDFPVEEVGPLLERHPFFPNRTNVEFVEAINSGEIRMRVWERGTGETPACGTGACAAVVAASLKGLVGGMVTVHLGGGDLRIGWRNRMSHVYMTGPAKEVFRGVVNLADII